MDKHNHEHHGSGFMNGFLLGAIIGAAVVFFLFTEKGKKLLKTITEEGIEGFGDIRDLVESEMDGDEEDYEESSYDESSDDRRPVTYHSEHSHVEPLRHEYKEESQQPSKAKRFFRGIKRS